ncbi:L,D-transpeptidase [Sinanaerobacter sp. ZZT-01]|uniref:L,D-transpeptidase n=1 Tax=Sinanaerobacter sp. ZZT-01 TaxID=3111540 RepID=UPI002D78FE84|nr:L,D-transpeptidase [Sinanaerobacter sp. ZZT-01]WRR92110.1 L,D-transpeptidase [Sinanaerobacter sp. ZZT-01]
MKPINILCTGCAAMLLLSVVLLLSQKFSYDTEHTVLRVKVSEPSSAVRKEEEKNQAIDFIVEEEIVEPSFPVKLKYNAYPMTLSYVVCEGDTNIHALPSQDAKLLRTAQKWEKLQYIESITFFKGVKRSTGEKWYHVYWYENEDGEVFADGSGQSQQGEGKNTLKKVFGFVGSDFASRRYFDFHQMEEKIQKLEGENKEGNLTYISNYKNYYGLPPLCKGKEVDEGGTPRSQSAPGYFSATKNSSFIYIPDGTLVKCLEYVNGFWHVRLVQNETQYFVPERYILRKEALTTLSKIIVIDRKNQNITSFEKYEGNWQITSCSLATTGTTNQYAQPTPLGCYFVIEKKPQFYYIKDGTDEIQGYAPYTLRFCGGAYIHGVSVSYKWENGKRIDPGLKEFSSSIGTVPLSHKCVRNYTSHAKFLYDWYTQNETVVLVIEP